MKQDLTPQIEDEIALAQRKGYQFVLYVRKSTVLSQDILNLLGNGPGTIQLEYLGW